MPDYTEKLNLEKPLQNEYYNVDKNNENMDKIDKFAKELKSDIDTHSGNETVHITAMERTIWDGKAPGIHNHTKIEVGLGNVDNTSDANKSVASAGKLNDGRTLTIGAIGKIFDGSANITWTLAEIGLLTAIDDKFKNFCPIVVGALMLLDNASNPATIYPGTTWSKIENRFLYGSTSSGQTGGASTVSLTIDNMPSHRHNSWQGAHSHVSYHSHGAWQESHVHSVPVHAHAVNRSQWNGNNWQGDAFQADSPGSGGTLPTHLGGGDHTGGAIPGVYVNPDYAHSDIVQPPIYSDTVGSGTPINILPPHYTINIWKRLS